MEALKQRDETIEQRLLKLIQAHPEGIRPVEMSGFLGKRGLSTYLRILLLTNQIERIPTTGSSTLYRAKIK